MHRYVHRTGVGVIGWRQASGTAVVAALAPRDAHRRVVSRGRLVRVAAGFTAAGITSVASDSTASYVIRASVNADAAASYAVRAAVVADAVASYNILSVGSVVSDATASYVIRAAVIVDAVASYFIGDAPASTAGAITRPLRLQSGARPARIQ